MGAPYKTCPWCGAHLDHGERCECTTRAQEEREAARIVPTRRAYGPAIIGVDLAQGKDLTAKAYIPRR